VVSQDKGYRAKCHSPWQARRTGLRRLEALLCLLIITAQLALVVVHSWEVLFEERAVATARVSRAFLTDATGATTLSKAATLPRRHAHDPLLCPVCRLLSQARHVLAPHDPGMLFSQTRLKILLGSSCPRSHLALAVSAPRAPPSCL
jgi:hypothetical protein